MAGALHKRHTISSSLEMVICIEEAFPSPIGRLGFLDNKLKVSRLSLPRDDLLMMRLDWHWRDDKSSNEQSNDGRFLLYSVT